MNKFGLIGKSLSHSFSPKYFGEKFRTENIDATYDSFEMNDLDNLRSFIFSNTISGLNVTIPFKKSVIPFLDGLDFLAKDVQAVNTIKVIGDKLIGYNTDVIGFQKSLEKVLENKHKSAIILGTGGASLAIKHALKRLDIPYKMVSRTKSASHLSYSDLTPKLLKTYELIINTTPLGMSPTVDEVPNLPLEALTSKHIVFDLIYNPEKTKLLTLAEKQGSTIKNGLEMLHLQAEESWRIWNT